MENSPASRSPHGLRRRSASLEVRPAHAQRPSRCAGRAQTQVGPHRISERRRHGALPRHRDQRSHRARVYSLTRTFRKGARILLALNSVVRDKSSDERQLRVATGQIVDYSVFSRHVRRRCGLFLLKVDRQLGNSTTMWRSLNGRQRRRPPDRPDLAGVWPGQARRRVVPIGEPAPGSRAIPAGGGWPRCRPTNSSGRLQNAKVR